jgi:hypothetical protein
MKKYAKRSAVKFRTEKKDGIPGEVKSISKYDKLITKNANRGLKKQVRQKAKKDIDLIISNNPDLNQPRPQLKLGI